MSIMLPSINYTSLHSVGYLPLDRLCHVCNRQPEYFYHHRREEPANRAAPSFNFCRDHASFIKYYDVNTSSLYSPEKCSCKIELIEINPGSYKDFSSGRLAYFRKKASEAFQSVKSFYQELHRRARQHYLLQKLFDVFQNIKSFYQELQKQRRELKHCSDYSMVENWKCSICLDSTKEDLVAAHSESMDKNTKKVGHVYHESCIEKWKKTKNTCPFCRAALSLKKVVICKPFFRPGKAYFRIEETVSNHIQPNSGCRFY